MLGKLEREGHVAISSKHLCVFAWQGHIEIVQRMTDRGRDGISWSKCHSIIVASLDNLLLYQLAVISVSIQGREGTE